METSSIDKRRPVLGLICHTLLKLGLDHVLLALIVATAAVATLFYVAITIPSAPKFDIWDNPYSRAGDTLHDGLGNTTAHLMFFFQISDLHLSEKQQKEYRVYDRFDRFCQIVRLTKPEFVVCTGDLTDSKASPLHGQQNETEWMIYKNILVKHGLFDPQKWIDLAGNHDRYGVPSPTSPLNYFGRYSTTSARNDTFHSESGYNGVYSTLFRTSAGNFRVVVLDTSLPVGISFPLNFHSLLYHETLTAFQGELEATTSENSTALVIGHYPSNTINSPMGLAPQTGIISTHAQIPFPAYLCGHLHLNNLYTRMPSSSNKQLLELELGDFKSKAVYRILAFDSDLLSFVDVELDLWPAVLVLNPKDARFLLPQEPLHRMTRSTHVRVLVFSTSPIRNVTLWIDDEKLGEMSLASSDPSSPPLYVHPWVPTQYSDGMHTIRVVAIDANNDVTETAHQFSLDGQTRRLTLFASIVQTREMKLVFNCIFFGIFAIVMVFFLLVPKCFWIIVTVLHTKFKCLDNIHTLYFRMKDAHLSDSDLSNGQEDSSKAQPEDEQSEIPAQSSSTNSPDDNKRTDLVQELPSPQDLDQPEANVAPTQPLIQKDPAHSVVFRAVMAYVFHFAAIPAPQWLVLVGSGVLFLVIPWVIAPSLGEGTGWGIVTIWGVWCNGIFLPSMADVMEHTGLPVLCFMWLPLVLYSALPHYHSPLRSEIADAIASRSTRNCHQHLRLLNALFSLFWARGAFFVVTILTCMVALNFVYVSAYGLLTMITSPILLWWSGICLAMILFSQGLQVRAMAPRIKTAVANIRAARPSAPK